MLRAPTSDNVLGGIKANVEHNVENSANVGADPGLFDDEELDVVLEAWGWKDS